MSLTTILSTNSSNTSSLIPVEIFFNMLKFQVLYPVLAC
jgi:hypothetical protein